MIKKNIVLSFLILICLPFWTLAQTVKPNILIILADDLGYHDVSYYGTTDVRTPNIDMLCKAGMRFDHFYASPVCAPTRASLMSGRYPEMVGVPGLIRSPIDANFGFLTPGTILLPELLKQQEYHSALIGKWNLGFESPNKPNEKGFDVFHGFLEDMMEDYWTHVRHGKNFMRENDTEINPQGHATDLFTNWAVDYIKTQRESKNPFFMYLAYNAPHYPIQPKEEWLARIKKRQPDITDQRAKLLALIEHMDDGIGQVVKSLKETGKYDNTIILFLSDNGGDLPYGANNGTLKESKGTLYEGGIRVPALAVWPGKIKAGTVNNEKVLAMDIYPTLSEITGTQMNHQIDGISFLSILKGQTEKLTNRPVFFSRREGGIDFGGQTIQALILDDWKLLQNRPFQPFELYNLKNDPFEKENLVKTESVRYKMMLQLITKQIQKSGSTPWQKP